MNAYELANELENKDRLWNVDENLMLKNCAMLRQQADHIAELEKAQTKELSDEEIYELWCESDNTELLPEMRNKDGSINYIILTFAELLLKKASEK